MGAVVFILYVGCILWWGLKGVEGSIRHASIPCRACLPAVPAVTGVPFVHLQFFGFVLVLGLLIQLVWALLWYSFKWYNELKSKYEPSGEADDYRE